MSSDLNSMDNMKYFTSLAKRLSSREKIVSLMLDEIYIKEEVVYKNGKLDGYAEASKDGNPSNIAKTVQTFMLESVFGNTKVC